MEQLKWGMIGVGDVTERKSGPALYKTQHSSLLGVTSRTYAKAIDYAERHGIGRVYNDVSEMLADDQIDIVYIATPPDTHCEYSIQAMQAGKAVYVEKPMAMSVKEAEAMLAVAEQTGSKLFVAFYRRTLPYFDKIRQLLAEGAIGTVLTVSVRLFRPPFLTDLDRDQHTWRIKREIGGEGYFMDLAPHTLDILDYLLGAITSQNGHALNLAGNYDVPDTVSANWQHASGALGSGLWCFSALAEVADDNIVITGTKGQLSFNTFDFKPIELVDASGKTLFDFDRPEHIQQSMIESIVSEFLGNGTCPSTDVSALRTAYVAEHILKDKNP